MGLGLWELWCLPHSAESDFLGPLDRDMELVVHWQWSRQRNSCCCPKVCVMLRTVAENGNFRRGNAGVIHQVGGE